MRREPALGMGGFPGQKLYVGERLLGTITRRGAYSFNWVAENGEFRNGQCVRSRSGGNASTAEEAEKAITRAVGITQEEFES